MNEQPYVEALVDLETADNAGEIIARIENAWDAIDQANATRMEQLIYRQLIRTVRAMTIAGVIGTLLWFATVAGWL